ncbi:hypothetical protein [Methylopila sp. 73B]|uniref:hypothetical protein n=1 Tax=Methylopila sp. 73B TaxID=1120792 RepID=UPI001FD927F7|nr:hypothetical protein [Methylopila sp. 73B]
MSALQRELREQGVVSRTRSLKSDGAAGVPLRNGPLAHLLANRVYLGEINRPGARRRWRRPGGGSGRRGLRCRASGCRRRAGRAG